MVNVLADLALESEAATATALRLARAYDEGDTRVPPLRHRGREVLGLQARDAARGRGAGVPRRQRLRRGVADAAAAARRAAERDLGGLGQRHRARRPARAGARARRACPRSWPSASWRAAANARLDAHLDALPVPSIDDVGRARRAVEDLALAFQASLLVRHAPPFVSDAFCAARLGGGGRVYGTLPAGVDGTAIVARALETVLKYAVHDAPEAERRVERARPGCPR